MTDRRERRRSSATRAAYYRGGRRHPRRAQEAYPDLAPVAALVALVEGERAAMEAATRPGVDGPDRLRTRTIGVYRAEMRVIVAVLGRAGGHGVDQVADAMARIDAALVARRGDPHEPRTASLKAKDVTFGEARAVFAELRRHTLVQRYVSSFAAALYVMVVPRVGVRPVELCGAAVADGHLWVRCAKRGDGSQDWRSFDLRAHPASVIEATRVLVDLAPADPAGVPGWHRALAESLARACARCGKRRLAPSSFRHVAIATWERAGYSAEQIAAMAGHLGLATARRHYARGRHGWDLPALARPGPDGTGAAANVTPTDGPAAADDLVIDAMPRPAAEPAPAGSANEAARAWREARAAEARALVEGRAVVDRPGRSLTRAAEKVEHLANLLTR